MKTFFFIAICGLYQSVFSQQRTYFVNLVDIQNDQVQVKAQIQSNFRDSVDYHFPSTIPGTYDILDYGKYISDFSAYDSDNKALTTQKLSQNSWRIYQPENLYELSYKVHDTFDTLVKEHKIFEPAGTNIERRKNILLNGGGFIGFFDKEENLPFKVLLELPDSMLAFSSHPQEMMQSKKDRKVGFLFQNYHDFIDNPILVAKPDTATFWVQQTKVTVACYHEKGIPIAQDIKKNIEKSIVAIGNFLPELPVKEYAFLIYIKDFEKELQTLQKTGFFKKISLILKLSKLGFGALEHGQSSVYYLFDSGNKDFLATLQSIVIHEFMHIVTPLSLHTEPIGNFNYIKPTFSKHLWLYEGITEYFAGLIQIQNNLITLDSYLDEFVKDKIETGRKFPVKKMTFTEMSSNVMLPKYQKEYAHVYDYGAMLALILDIEIIRLTKGEKTLKDIVITLMNRYGKNQNANEDNLIREFVELVHPDLQSFFDAYILGNQYPDFERFLGYAGIIYEREVYANVPISIRNGEVAKDGKGEFSGFLKGDKVKRTDVKQATNNAQGGLLPHGTITAVEVERNGLKVKVEFPVLHKKGELEFMKNPSSSEEMKKIRKIWIHQN